jgi:hypothetical protein
MRIQKNYKVHYKILATTLTSIEIVKVGLNLHKMLWCKRQNKVG